MFFSYVSSHKLSNNIGFLQKINTNNNNNKRQGAKEVIYVIEYMPHICKVLIQFRYIMPYKFHQMWLWYGTQETLVQAQPADLSLPEVCLVCPLTQKKKKRTWFKGTCLTHNVLAQYMVPEHHSKLCLNIKAKSEPRA